MVDSQTISSVLGGAGVIGGGVAWVWGKVEGRFKALETKLASNEKRLKECQERDFKSRTLMSNMLFGMKMLADEVAAFNPASPALAYVRHVLEHAFPLGDTPTEMIETLDELD